MFGLFVENGPLRVTRNGTGDGDFQIGPDVEGSWGDLVDIVFVDQPVGVGFSYGAHHIDRMLTGADEFVNLTVAFLDKYPEYKSRDLILAGESFAGKYISLIANRIIFYNQ
jgi:carboxypeptidase C (cathepsin A)